MNIPKDWENFKTTLLDKYFLDNIRAQKELEFQLLHKGSMTSPEFATKFKDMTTYSNQAMYAPDECWKINQCKIGLRG